MITCPNCKNTLPDWATTCQFCQTNVQNVPRPRGAGPTDPDDVRPHGGKLPDKTIWSIYYSICALWILTGAANIWDAFRTGSSSGPNFIGYLFLAFGVFQALIGIGLFLRVEAIRGLVNVVSFLLILRGLFSLANSLLLMMALGAWGLILVVMSLVMIIVGGATMWILSETMGHAPNT